MAFLCRYGITMNVNVSPVILSCAYSSNSFRLRMYRGGLAEILCKPKILPLKSAVLEQLQKIEREVEVKEEGEEDVLNIRDHK